MIDFDHFCIIPLEKVFFFKIHKCTKMSHFDILNEIILAIAMYMYFSMIDQADISGSYSYIYIVESGIEHLKPLFIY